MKMVKFKITSKNPDKKSTKSATQKKTTSKKVLLERAKNSLQPIVEKVLKKRNRDTKQPKEPATTETFNKSEQRCIDLIAAINGYDAACKFNLACIHLMLHHPNLTVRKSAYDHLAKWLNDTTTTEGIEYIGGDLGVDEVADLVNLLPLLDPAIAALQKKSNEITDTQNGQNLDNESDENQIVKFFKSLTLRERLIVNAYSWIQCLGSNIGSNSENLDKAISDAVDFDDSEVPNDPELKWLQALCQLASSSA